MKGKRGGGQGGEGQASNFIGHCEDVDFFFLRGMSSHGKVLSRAGT